MPFGVPELGDAYIDVHANTRSLRPEVRAAAAVAGRDFGESFGDAAETSLGAQSTRLAQRIEQSLGRKGRLSGEDFAEALEDGVRRKMRDFDMGIITGAMTGDWSGVVEQFDDFNTGIEAVRRRLRELREDGGSAGNAVNEMRVSLLKWEIAARQSAGFSKLVDEALEMNRTFDKQRAVLRRSEEDIQRQRDAFNGMVDTYRRVSLATDRNLAPAFARFREAAAGAREEFERLESRLRTNEEVLQRAGRGTLAQESGITRLRNAYRRLRFDVVESSEGVLTLEDRHRRSFNRMIAQLRDYDSHVSILGRLSGNRNNFLNAIGRSAGFFERAFGKVIDLMGEAPAAFLRLKSAADAAGGGFRGWTSALAQSSSALVAAAGGWPGIALAIASLVASLVILAAVTGPAVAGIGGVIGALTALAGTLVFGAIGALLPLAGFFPVLAGAAGAAVIAFTELGDTYAAQLKPLGEWVSALRAPIQERLFANLGAQAESLRGTLENFVSPLLLAAADSFRGVLDYLVGAFQRPEVQSTLVLMGEQLPGILGPLGQALTDVITGLLGLFTAIAPYTQQLAEGISGIARDLSDMINDPAGREEFVSFFDRAWASARQLKDLAGELVEAFFNLFTEGSVEGDKMVGKITELVNQFNTWFQQGGGREELRSWFQFAGELAGKLGGAVGEVGGALRRLDTPENRTGILVAIELFGKLLANTIDFVGWIGKVSFKVFDTGSRVISIALDAIDAMAGAVEGLVRALGRIKWPSPPSWVLNGFDVPWNASGAIYSGPRIVGVGEAGPEAIVPLNRPLSQVDPSVRWLSAIAQGMTTHTANPAPAAPARNISPGAIVVNEVNNGRFTAERILDRLAEDAAR